MNSQSENYLKDLVTEILGVARLAKQRALTTREDFDKGRLMAFYTVLSLIKQQAIAFGISEENIGLNGIDLEREFLGKD